MSYGKQGKNVFLLLLTVAFLPPEFVKNEKQKLLSISFQRTEARNKIYLMGNKTANIYSSNILKINLYQRGLPSSDITDTLFSNLWSLSLKRPICINYIWDLCNFIIFFL